MPSVQLLPLITIDSAKQEDRSICNDRWNVYYWRFCVSYCYL